MPDHPDITMAELREAWSRARLLHFHGWTFDRALQVPVLRWALERSALSRRSTTTPAQPRLF